MIKPLVPTDPFLLIKDFVFSHKGQFAFPFLKKGLRFAMNFLQKVLNFGPENLRNNLYKLLSSTKNKISSQSKFKLDPENSVNSFIKAFSFFCPVLIMPTLTENAPVVTG